MHGFHDDFQRGSRVPALVVVPVSLETVECHARLTLGAQQDAPFLQPRQAQCGQYVDIGLRIWLAELCSREGERDQLSVPCARS